MKNYLASFCLLLFLLISHTVFAQKDSGVIKHITTTEITKGASVTFPVVVALIALVSSILSIGIALKVKDKEYKNDYYKKVIDKRIVAYGYLESQIAIMRETIIDKKERKGYLLMFGKGKDYYLESLSNIQKALTSGLWITPATLAVLGRMNAVFLNIALQYDISDAESLREAGKAYFKELSQLRFELEVAVREDVYSLHNVKSFFKLERQDSSNLDFDSLLDFDAIRKPQ